MKCHEAKRHLDLFMDGELSVQENMKVLAHLNLCRGCAGVYEGEKALRAELKAQAGAVRAPEGMVDRLLGGVDGGKVASFRRPWGASVAAAAFFIGLVGLLIFTPPTGLPEVLAEEMVAQHEVCRKGYAHAMEPGRQCLCEKCCPDELLEGRVDAFFAGHDLDQVCHHPELENMGYRFSGVAVWPHRGERVFWSVRRKNEGGAAITHGLVSMPVALGGSMATVACKGRVVFFKPRSDRPGLTCVFIFDEAKQLETFRSLLAAHKN